MDLERLPLRGNPMDTLELPELDIGADIVQSVSLTPGSSLEVPSLTLQSESSDSHAESEPEMEKEQEKDPEEAKETPKNMPKRGRPPLGKRKRNVPAKFSDNKEEETPTSVKRTRATRASTKVKTETPDSSRVVKRGSRCGKCAGCIREDCGKCVYCLDKPKFGGPAKKKQRCALRTCSNFEHRRRTTWMKPLDAEQNNTTSTETGGGGGEGKTLLDYIAVKKVCNLFFVAS